MSFIFFLIERGLIPFFLLYDFCISLLLSVSLRARSIDPVILSAYKTTLPSTLRAARPIVCIKEVSDLRNPSCGIYKKANTI